MRPTRIEPLTLFANRALDSGELFLRRRSLYPAELRVQRCQRRNAVLHYYRRNRMKSQFPGEKTAGRTVERGGVQSFLPVAPLSSRAGLCMQGAVTRRLCRAAPHIVPHPAFRLRNIRPACRQSAAPAQQDVCTAYRSSSLTPSSIRHSLYSCSAAIASNSSTSVISEAGREAYSSSISCALHSTGLPPASL